MPNLKKTFCVFPGDDPYLVFWERNKNSLYSRDARGRAWFRSKKTNETLRVDLEWILLDPNEALVAEISKWIDHAIQVASVLSEEQVVVLADSKRRVESIVWSKTYCASARNWPILRYVAEIFTCCLMGHCFGNGNKRFSLAFLVLILNSFGYHFPWTAGSRMNYKRYDELLAALVRWMEKRAQKTKKAIADWISASAVVSIPRFGE